MMYALFLIPVVVVYAVTAWIEGVVTWRVNYLLNTLITYAKKEGLCSIT